MKLGEMILQRHDDHIQLNTNNEYDNKILCFISLLDAIYPTSPDFSSTTTIINRINLDFLINGVDKVAVQSEMKYVQINRSNDDDFDQYRIKSCTLQTLERDDFQVGYRCIVRLQGGDTDISASGYRYTIYTLY